MQEQGAINKGRGLADPVDTRSDAAQRRLPILQLLEPNSFPSLICSFSFYCFLHNYNTKGHIVSLSIDTNISQMKDSKFIAASSLPKLHFSLHRLNLILIIFHIILIIFWVMLINPYLDVYQK